MGPFFIPKASVKKDSCFLTACEKLPQEKLHLKFCKNILVVNSKASSFAVRNDIGQYPLRIQTLANMFKYLIHLKTTDNELLEEEYELS